MTNTHLNNTVSFQVAQKGFMLLFGLIFYLLIITPTSVQGIEKLQVEDNVAVSAEVETRPEAIESLDIHLESEFDLNSLFSWDEDEMYECEWMLEYPGVCVIRV